MKSKKIILDKITIITLILFIYFEPQMFKSTYYPICIKIDLIYKILKLLSAFWMFSIYSKEKKYSKLFCAMLLFQIFSFISTFVMDGSFSRFIGPSLTTLVMIMAVETLIHEKKLFTILKRCIIYYRIGFVINVISMYVVDYLVNVSVVNYFFGIDNRFVFSYLPWLTFEFLYSMEKYGKISKTSICMFILSELTLLYKFSLAAMIISFIWILVLIVGKKTVKHFRMIFLSTVVANISVVILRIQDRFELLLNDLHKGTTLSGRTYLWDAILKDVKNYPILGRGMQSVEYERKFFIDNSGMSYFETLTPHGHNSYMTVLQRSGLIGLILYFYILWICVCKLAKNFNNKFAKILMISFVIALILSIFDTVDCSGFYFILACSYNINLISSDEQEKKEYA